MKQFPAILGTVFARLILAVVLLAPIAVYIRIFGFEISNDHGRWGEMGSAMSGIYGPILALLAFIVLILQVRMQQETNKHMLDQSYLQDNRADVEFYLTRLLDILDKPLASGHIPRNGLHDGFEIVTVEQLLNDEFKQLARALDYDVPQVKAMWRAIYSIFAGLASVDESQYRLHFSSAKQKAVAMLSFRTCVALDQYMHCLTEGNTSQPYQFSRDLISE